MSDRDSFLTRWLTKAPDWLFACYAIATSFSTYFCMYAFRKPFAAATYEDLDGFFGLDLKTALVISQIVGYTLSKVVGMRVCSELARANRALLLTALIVWAQSALVAFAVAPPSWKVIAILLNGLPLGMIWGLVVRYLEGRRVSELVLAGLSCSYIVSSGIVKDVGRSWMDAGVSDVWMPAVTGFCFLPLYIISVWLLNQVPEPSVADMTSRSERPRMDRADRIRFVSQFGFGLLLLFTVYFFLTAYRDFRDNYGIEIFQALGYADTPAVFTRTEFPVAIGVMMALAVLNIFQNHRNGLIAVYTVMTLGLLLMIGATLMLDAGLLLGRELWWMVLVGLGSYLAYVPFGTALFERLLASTHFRGNAVFAIYIADSVGYTGSIALQVYKDLFQSNINRFEFFHGFTYAFSSLGAGLLVASCIYFYRRHIVRWTHRRLDLTPTKHLPLHEPCSRKVPVGQRTKIHIRTSVRGIRATFAFSFIVCLGLMPSTTLKAQEPEPRTTDNRTNAATADVIVYGSTPGGFCAAIAAAREGASVILLEPTDHVGAMSTGGLSHCDSNQMVRSTLMGLFDEWHTRVVKDYTNRGLTAPYDPAKKDQSRWTFEPHVAMRVTVQMLDEAGVTMLTERYLNSVTKDGPRIASLVTDKGTFTAKVYVDGTYEGDLMAAAGVDWTIGREGREEYGESLAGKQYPKQKMNINGFDDQGRLLPLITTDDAGDERAGDKNVMTYSFRLCLTEDPDNRVPMPKPANYAPVRFEIVRRALQAGEKRVGFDLYPLPGRKLDGNNSIGGQFSIGLVGGGKDWHSADKAGRKKIWEAHKQYTLEFYHFLTTDPAVPKAMRDRYARLGLCKDEFANYDHFSPALYVRESRRMKGQYVISQKDILETPKKDDPIAISSFPIDSHDCQRIALKGGGVINEGTIFPVRRKNPKQGYAYHVPYRSILPKPEQCDNLLVPVALSCTHVGISSLRIEGAWMVIGQGAGIAAALAADQNVPVQKLAYAKLRERLLAQGQVLELPDVSDLPTRSGSIAAKSLPGIVLDDAQAKLSGTWSRSTNFKPYIEAGYIFCGEDDPKSKGDGATTATFRFQVPKSGRYQVLMAYSAHASRAKHVPVMVSSGAEKKTFTVDQTKPLPTGKHFRLVATIDLQADAENVIQITNAGTTGFVILDALQLLPVESKPTTKEID